MTTTPDTSSPAPNIGGCPRCGGTRTIETVHGSFIGNPPERDVEPCPDCTGMAPGRGVAEERMVRLGYYANVVAQQWERHPAAALLKEHGYDVAAVMAEMSEWAYGPGRTLAIQQDGGTVCEFCGGAAPPGQYHPKWHDDGAPMVACDECLADTNSASSSEHG